MFSMEHWPYDAENEKLMEAFWKATIRAGTSNSGLVIDPSGNYYAKEAFYFYGVILSRLGGKQPPFKHGDKVRMDPRATYYCCSVDQHEGYGRGETKPDTEYEVWQVFYEKVYRGSQQGGTHFNWTISFKNKDGKLDSDYRFPAERFEKVEQKEPAVA